MENARGIVEGTTCQYLLWVDVAIGEASILIMRTLGEK